MHAFLQLMRDLRDGSAIEEARRAIAEVEEAVADTGKAGRVTLTIDIEPVKGGLSTMVTITDTITLKKPARDREKTVLFRTGDGQFSRYDPRQPELPSMRTVKREDDQWDSTEENAV